MSWSLTLTGLREQFTLDEREGNTPKAKTKKKREKGRVEE